MDVQKNKIRLGIYSIGLLMMGVIGITSALATIGANFPDASQTMIQNLVSISAIVIIPTTIIVGKMMERFSKKPIALAGSLAFLVGGVAPVFMKSFTAILVMRGLLGIGVGISQVVSVAIIAEHFSGAEQEKVQGILQSSQMAGAAIMVFVGGWLADIQWNNVFFVHLIAILPLILVSLRIPNNRPIGRKETGGNEIKEKSKFTKATWGWILFMFVLFISVQVYSISLSFIVEEKGIGGAADSGLGLAFFAIGGIIMGLLYGSFARLAKNNTIGLGCLMVVVSYLIIAYAKSMLMCHIGSFIVGMAVSSTLPGIFINVSSSVDMFSVGMALSVVTGSQNFGQFICPYIINPIAMALGKGVNHNFMVFIVGAILAAALAILMLIWGTKKNRELATN